MNLKKGIALALTAAALMAFTGCGSNGTTSNGEYKVGVVQLVEHPALDAANKGFVDALFTSGTPILGKEQKRASCKSEIAGEKQRRNLRADADRRDR